MNIIFCDVDGTLNSISHLKELYYSTGKHYSGFNYPFDDKCLNNLKLLVDDNTRIVISSTWRKFDDGIIKLMEELKKLDLDSYVIGFTPTLNMRRGEEIKSFIENTDIEIKHFVILDDDSDMGDLLPYLVKTNIQTGLTYENVLEARKILDKEINLKLKK